MHESVMKGTTRIPPSPSKSSMNKKTTIKSSISLGFKFIDKKDYLCLQGEGRALIEIKGGEGCKVMVVH